MCECVGLPSGGVIHRAVGTFGKRIPKTCCGSVNTGHDGLHEVRQYFCTLELEIPSCADYLS